MSLAQRTKRQTRLWASRAGGGFEMVDQIPKFAMIFAVALGVVFLIQYALALTVETQNLRTEVFLQRVLSSPSGVVYVDPETGVAWPGTIALEKFDEERLQASIAPNAKDWIAAELELVGFRTIRFNGEQYAEWQRMVAAGTGVSVQRELPVLVHTPAGMKRGTLRVTMITPRD